MDCVRIFSLSPGNFLFGYIWIFFIWCLLSLRKTSRNSQLQKMEMTNLLIMEAYYVWISCFYLKVVLPWLFHQFSYWQRARCGRILITYCFVLFWRFLASIRNLCVFNNKHVISCYFINNVNSIATFPRQQSNSSLKSTIRQKRGILSPYYKPLSLDN